MSRMVAIRRQTATGRRRGKDLAAARSGCGLRSQQSGFTLIEAVIAATILSVTMLVATLAFTTIVQLQQKAATVRQVQQNTRYIVEAISRDIRNANLHTLNGTDLRLANSLNPDDRIRYDYDSATQAVYRLRCQEGDCDDITEGDNLTQRQIRVVEFRLSTTDGSASAPIRVYIRTQQLTPGLNEENPYFYEYETTALVVPRR